MQLAQLDRAATLVYVDLCCHAGSDATAWPNQQTIADELGLSVGSVRRAIAVLRKAGAIRTEFVERRGRPMQVQRLCTDWWTSGG